ncbi:site-specific DNA-methyltransferase [Salinisphaera sp. P385]|uniref:site-specific DNA-methyltransferase (adenine-specific) n=1 Tax=Spectribacter acetivorans TaxID=3075603 RepID=A0ABU3BE14_9GAMM|nr:site-specific DNA-methyltransferase [Salinisphaera sp. P385]MDT0619891.1 site-specific DNA-methyltransferase [Salinisphaera sp. P385]
MARKQQTAKKSVEALQHDEAKRKNIPTAEHQSVVDDELKTPIQVAYERRNRALDPQLIWRGKDQQDWSDLVVNAPPLYIQEKVHPKALIDDLQRESREREHEEGQITPDLFRDFNGLPKGADRTDFYQYDANWQNRMILGDSLQVMASLAEREGLRGQVQCIYLDPPYGIKFNSNFQWSTTSRDVKDGKAEHITREPEQVKAFRDTWRDGIHSYLTYLRDRLTVARDLLHESGSIFVQIGDENVHRVRLLMDEVFGEENFVSLISFKTSIGLGSEAIDNTTNYLVWYGKSESIKCRSLYHELTPGGEGATRYKTALLPDMTEQKLASDDLFVGNIPEDARLYRDQGFTSRSASKTTLFPVTFRGRTYLPSSGGWRTSETGMARAQKADRILRTGNNISFRKFFDDFGALGIDNFWKDVSGGITSRSDPKIYVVQTSNRIVERCMLMATDPGDLVLDPTCGSGTTATVAEQWGRRWVTIDTSRVALALARARIMGARYPFYLLADSHEGQQKEAEVTRSAPSTAPTRGDIRQGFVYERVPHITLKSIANNAEIDVIWERFQETLEPLREKLNAALGAAWEEWEIPREAGDDWPAEAKDAHAQWWEQRIARQKEIDASIAANADQEYLYDKPYTDNRKVRVAGPFTVESLSPHRVLGVDENDELIDQVGEDPGAYDGERDFTQMILENLKTAGVQQAHKEDAINFTSITPWPGELVCAEGRYMEGDEENGTEKRAAIFVGPEFGTVSRPDLVEAAREAGDADFDVLIVCAFNYEAHATEFEKLGRIPVLKARMNADLHMADDLKNTGKGNLFVIFGEPDIDILDTDDSRLQVKVNGVDVFHPNSGEVRSDGPDGIACWFIDTDYDMESFFVRHAYFLGAADPYKSLRTTLKAEINEEAWETLHSDTSRPFERPKSGRIAVKVINHLGDEVMKVFRA